MIPGKVPPLLTGGTLYSVSHWILSSAVHSRRSDRSFFSKLILLMASASLMVAAAGGEVMTRLNRMLNVPEILKICFNMSVSVNCY